MRVVLLESFIEEPVDQSIDGMQRKQLIERITGSEGPSDSDYARFESYIGQKQWRMFK